MRRGSNIAHRVYWFLRWKKVTNKHKWSAVFYRTPRMWWTIPGIQGYQNVYILRTVVYLIPNIRQEFDELLSLVTGSKKFVTSDKRMETFLFTENNELEMMAHLHGKHDTFLKLVTLVDDRN